MHSQIASLKVMFKEMEERKASSLVEEVEKPHSNSGDQFGGRNQKRVSRGN